MINGKNIGKSGWICGHRRLGAQKKLTGPVAAKGAAGNLGFQ